MTFEDIIMNIAIGVLSGIVSSIIVTLCFNWLTKKQTEKLELQQELLYVPQYVRQQYSELFSLLTDFNTPFVVKMEFMENIILRFPVFPRIESEYPDLYDEISEFFKTESESIKYIILASKDKAEKANETALNLFLEVYAQELRESNAKLVRSSTKQYLELSPKKKK